LRILVPNLGSASLKYQLIETQDEAVLARGKIDHIGGAASQIITWEAGSAQESRSTAHAPDHRAAFKILVDRLFHLEGGAGANEGIAAVGFKAVHGGPR
jgi:acetate kinase